MQLILDNRKALWNYQIEKTYTAGIVLKGSEVKSIRKKDITIKDSFAKIFRGEMFLINMHIAPYKSGSLIYGHDVSAMRKLLLKKKEISTLMGKMKEKGYALVPLKVFLSDKNLVKIELGLGKGKQLFDKRRVLKEKEIQKTEKQAMKKWSLS